ncbi:23S rRNA (uracil(1939)-C(5))-methyltransferase RlmD [Clostridium sp. CM028]|uniref:23S rRNA (uracil(1939)-C(5))-methyltransferase RlmD n=1 Tax=unclassified Clostridium TaxID=2614128 RepID=UPI001C0AB31F|nr:MULTISPECIES: 23S rRNA (uracil(1939)-C(5))-methyltransferase RlmD [unclassified Clostridium]MBU3093279.1 23S rRNA (uracil(1939)-C(5))-methyltransferase RlmD [Clostridium sp. CF011]MBW9144256.1 23S rRNA (uracil(1939)-C(5))-methyltransferase RlmD [Clostridium sp. CM027]MBW9147434.1 23S rRNA (uracil(1939)-C(5))-methyltransferase RlmD [Clostridium sp. CM028]UVE41107.1 23S rRNA (uracil(1939)-C(5))-methyltransferase RlmD [Clostridium sp. CM027]WAG70101.1 23S rRNA (uracil(1939)-C(5))-methyltransfe
MQKRKEYEFYIENLEFPAQGIAFYEGEKVLIKNTLPGQKVIAKVAKKKQDVVEAKLVKILEDVDYKIEPLCKITDLCGGCSHQFLSYEKQLEFKKQQVLKLFEQAEIKDFEFLGIEKSPEQFEYRNKMEFTFGDFRKGEELTLGMHTKGRSFSIVTVDDCRIVDVDFREILKLVLNYFKGLKFTHYNVMEREGYLRNLVIRKAQNTGEILVNIVTTSQVDFDFSEITNMLKELKCEGVITGIIHTFNDSLSDIVQADKTETLYGREYIMEELLDLKFKINPFAFFQTNTKGAEKLYSLVRDFLGESESKVVFDLYCGTGTIGQIVAAKAKKVLGIELIEEAVDAANENAKINKLDNCEFIAGDIAKVIKEVKDKPDSIILDPPRAGVHPTALDYVIKFDARHIVYVSCNPKSLVVDLKEMINRGYKVQKVILMDMFPHTPHIETIVDIVKVV